MTRYLSVTQLRLLIVGVNLVLIGMLVVEAMSSLSSFDLLDWGGDEPEEKNPTRVELAKFEYREQDFSGTPTKSGAVEMAMAAGKLQPAKPKPRDTTKSGPDEPTQPDEPTGADAISYEGGPLEEEGWEYTNYIFWPGQPLNTLVYLTKKEEKKGPRVRGRGNPRRSVRRSTTPTRRGGARGGAAAKRRTNKTRRSTTPTISSTVGDRWVVSEEHDLDFYIDSADTEKLVYWVEDNPKKLYALKYKPSPGWLSDNDRRKLEPQKDEEAEGDKEEEEKKQFFFKAGYLDGDREADYANLRVGKKASVEFAPRNTRSASKRRAKRPASKTKRRPISTPKSAREVQRKANKERSVRGERPKVSKEDVENLRETIKEIPEEDRKKLNEAIRGKPSK